MCIEQEGETERERQRRHLGIGFLRLKKSPGTDRARMGEPCKIQTVVETLCMSGSFFALQLTIVVVKCNTCNHMPILLVNGRKSACPLF